MKGRFHPLFILPGRGKERLLKLRLFWGILDFTEGKLKGASYLLKDQFWKGVGNVFRKERFSRAI